MKEERERETGGGRGAGRTERTAIDDFVPSGNRY